MLKKAKILTLLAYRNFLRNFKRTKVIIFIFVSSLIGVNFLMGITLGFGEQIKNFALDNFLGHIVVSNKEERKEVSVGYFINIDDKALEEIQALQGVVYATKRIKMPLIIKSERGFVNGMLVGIDIKNEKKSSFLGKAYNNFEILNQRGVLVGDEMLKELKTKKGYRIVLSGQDKNKDLAETGAKILDVFSSGLPNVAKMYAISSNDFVAKLAKLQNGAVTDISVVVNREANLKQTRDKISKIISKYNNTKVQSDVEVLTWKEKEPFIAQTLDAMMSNIFVMFGIIFLAITMPLSNTLLINVLERIPEYGILKSFGIGRLGIIYLVLLEGFLIMLLGAFSGTLISAILMLILQYTGINISVFGDGLSLMGIGKYLYPIFDVIVSLKLTILLFSIGLVVSLYPALKAALVSPIDALRKK